MALPKGLISQIINYSLRLARFCQAPRVFKIPRYSGGLNQAQEMARVRR